MQLGIGNGERRVPAVPQGQEGSTDSLPDRTCVALIEVSENNSTEPPDQLEAIATSLNRSRRPDDVIFRRGAKQIAILSTGVDDVTVTRTISRALGHTPGVRFAVTTAPTHGHSLEQLLAAADDLLHGYGKREHPRGSIH